MISSAIAFLVAKLGVDDRIAKAILIFAAVIAVIGIFSVGKCAYDDSIIEKDRLEQRADAAEADRKADEKAAEQRQEDTARLEQERRELERVMDNEVTDFDRRLAKHRCLRLQQSARAAGREPPSCS